MSLVLKIVKYTVLTIFFLILSIFILFLILFYSLSSGADNYIYHKGKYKDERAVGEFELWANYRLDNGNDARSFAKGNYDEKGLRQGYWTNQTAYSQGLYFYKDGILRQRIYTHPIQEASTQNYDENGTLIETRKPTKDECKILFYAFEKEGLYKNECFEILDIKYRYH